MGKQVSFYVTLTVEQDADPDTLYDDVEEALVSFKDWQGTKETPRVAITWPEGSLP